MNAYADTINLDARLYILKELGAQTDQRLNNLLVQRILETRYGISRSIEWVNTQLRKLAELDAVTIIESSVLIVQLTHTGRDHLAMRTVIDGITRPTELP